MGVKKIKGWAQLSLLAIGYRLLQSKTNMAAALRCVYDNSHMFLQDGSTTPLPKPYLPSIPPAKTRKQSYSRYGKS